MPEISENQVAQKKGFLAQVHAVKSILFWVCIGGAILWITNQANLNGFSNAKFLMGCIGLLMCGSLYATRELRALRHQGEGLQKQLAQQCADLKIAVATAHEDAVERNMIEDALKESQQRFYHLSEATFEAICFHDNGVILESNQNLTDLLGYTEEELQHKSLFDLHAPEVREEIKKRVRDNKTEVYETVVLRHDGTRLQVEVATKVMPFNGRRARVVAIRDLSARYKFEEEREHARQQILFSENSRKAILESSIDGILIFGQDDRIEDSNLASETIFGWDRSELIGRKVAETVVASSHRENYLRMLHEAKLGGQGFLGRRVKVRAVRKDGVEFDSEVTTTAIRGQGRTDFVAAVRDISERMQQKRQMESAATRMGAVLESMQAAVAVLDENQKVIRTNKLFCNMLNPVFESADLEGVVSGELESYFTGLFEEGASFWGRIRQTMTLRLPANSEELRTKDGRVMEAQYVLVSEKDIFQGHLLIFRDVSNRKVTEAQLKSARDAALDSARFKSQFLANMSHEIRTPMNAIVGMTDLLLGTSLDEEQEDFTHTVKQASESLLNLINQILDFSKIEAGKMTLEQQEFDLRELVEGIASMFAARAQSKGIELSVDLPPDLFTSLRGDSARLGQVLVNLVGNAIKFTEKGDVQLRVSQESADHESSTLKFVVKDSGVGIASEALKQLFRPFVQADGSITRRFGGTGLGLAISKELVELMGGQIGVESSVEGPCGTSFWVKICLERQVESKKNNVRSASPDLKNLKVLIADDNASNTLVISRELDAWKVLYGAADSAFAAKEMLRQAASEGKAFDVVLMDIQMPDQNGVSLAGEIAQDPLIPTPRMILMSALGHSPSKEIMAQSSIQACVNKPVKQAALLRALQGMSTPEAVYAEQPGKPQAYIVRPFGNFETNRRVLVAEDNTVNQRVIRSQMEKLGVLADIVSNGKEAVDAVASGRYALVLMDFQMPIMDGIAATREIRSREKAGLGKGHLPVVAMTASALQDDEKVCREAGMDDYLSKPVKLELLENMLNRWILVKPETHFEQDAHEAMPLFCDEDVRRGMGESYLEDGIFQELVGIFSQDTPQRLKHLEKAVKEHDSETVHQEAHAIKGSCRALGAVRMEDSCAKLEEFGRNKKIEKYEMCLELLTEEYQTTLEELLKTSSAPANAA